MKFLDSNITDAATKTTIGAAGVTYSFLGMSMSEMAALATFTYMVLQIIFLMVPKIKGWWKEWRSK